MHLSSLCIIPLTENLTYSESLKLNTRKGGQLQRENSSQAEAHFCQNKTNNASKSKNITYTREELLQINKNVEHNRKYRVIDAKTIVKIRESRLNKKKKRGRAGGVKKNPKYQAACNTKNNVNQNNLIQIPVTQEPKKAQEPT